MERNLIMRVESRETFEMSNIPTKNVLTLNNFVFAKKKAEDGGCDVKKRHLVC